MKAARDEILARVRSGLGRAVGAPVPALPPAARVAPRVPGDASAEMAALLAEIGNLRGQTRRITHREQLRCAVEQLVGVERVQRATLWDTKDLRDLCIAGTLETLGVTLVSPHAERWELAQCDLGVVGVDAALPETGTLVLRSAPEQPRMVSLLPRVLLAILRPSVLHADLHQALAAAQGSAHFVFVTGPSRTADIELTLTIGVHGPGALYVWSNEL
jgi:L-lactate dehydrogenase complex protein LldG